jgi:hypothetical protein
MATTVWKGRITFGMVSVPVRLYKAARRERIKFHHVYRSAVPPEIDFDEEPDERVPDHQLGGHVRQFPEPPPEPG